MSIELKSRDTFKIAVFEIVWIKFHENQWSLIKFSWNVITVDHCTWFSWKVTKSINFEGTHPFVSNFHVDEIRNGVSQKYEPPSASSGGSFSVFFSFRIFSRGAARVEPKSRACIWGKERCSYFRTQLASVLIYTVTSRWIFFSFNAQLLGVPA